MYYSAGWASPQDDGFAAIQPSVAWFSMNISRPFGMYSAGSMGSMVVSEVTQLQCIPGHATYSLHTSYINGIRELSYTTEYLGTLQDIWNDDLEGTPEPARPKLTRDDYEVMNWFALTDSFVNAISGSYPASVVATGNRSRGALGLKDLPSFAPTTYFAAPNGTLVLLDSGSWGFADDDGQSLDPNGTIISQTMFNLAYNNFTATGPVLSISQDMINEALANITLSTMYTLPIWNTTVEAKTTTYINIYSLTSPLNLYLPYALCLALAIPFLLLGANSLRLNGVPAIDGGFIQILTTTTGNRGLENAAAGGCLGGSENAPRELMDMKIRFGELVGPDDGGDKGGVKRAGFGTEDEVVSLRKRVVYGR
ncbi:hypothetical protein LOCC1_G008078 [Lachnellula occidentalis]|uniref:Uncharacterized protein n=1 Tax=Lachnellula occidentalis TaxID=215460 RepID=A0A8H8RI83_9HELO|nr:hypothetical protein LOCC1_G008078 [Lachnellula occidentalis]